MEHRKINRLPECPRLRPLNVFPVEIDGERLIVLQDPRNDTEPIAVSEALGLILHFCDGRHTPDDIRRDLQATFGVEISPADIRRVLERTDELLLLDNARFHEHRRRAEREFVESPVRPSAHAGGSYPATPGDLRRRLDDMLGDASDVPSAGDGTLVGLIAPHIDLRVGGRVYAPTYRLLEREFARSNGDLPETIFVILGTSHHGGDGLFIASRKDFETPLGPVPCDRAFLDRLEAALGRSISDNDATHRREHSIEFQVVFLRHLFGAKAEEGRVRIVPILVTSFHSFYENGDGAAELDEYRAFVAALRKTIRESETPVRLIVGGDLAHVGRKFGDPFDAEAVLETVAEADAELLEHVRALDSKALLDHIARDHDARKICGFPPMLAFLDALDVFGDCRGKLLRYEQWHEEGTASAVTYAGMAFYTVSGSGFRVQGSVKPFPCDKINFP